MEFNGRDYLEIKNSVSLNKVVNSSFSVEAWVEPGDDLELNDNKDYDEFHEFEICQEQITKEEQEEQAEEDAFLAEPVDE